MQHQGASIFSFWWEHLLAGDSHLPSVSWCNHSLVPLSLFLNWNIVDIQYDVSFRRTTYWLVFAYIRQWCDDVSLVTICSHMKLLQCYWPYSVCCIWHPRGLFILQLDAYTSYSCSPVLCYLPSLVYSLYLCFHFVLVFRFHMYVRSSSMFFSNLFRLTIPFRSIHVVTNGKNSFFFNGWVIFHYMCKPHLIYPFIHQWTLHLLPYLGYCK